MLLDVEWFEVMSTPAGWISLAGREKWIMGVAFPMDDRDVAVDVIQRQYENASLGAPHEVLESASCFFGDFFRGTKPSVALDVRLGGLGEFTRRTLEATAQIPWGETITYGELACYIGQPGAARAVGQALGCNPVPIVIPCHRVVASGGKLGGFGGGSDWKRRLLKLEGVEL